MNLRWRAAGIVVVLAAFVWIVLAQIIGPEPANVMVVLATLPGALCLLMILAQIGPFKPDWQGVELLPRRGRR